MTHISRRSKIAHTFLSMVFMMLFAPVALTVPANPGVNEAGEWFKPGPGYVQRETGEPGEDVYIVQHQAPPLALYRGNIPGLAATSPEANGVTRLDTGSSASQAYLSYVAGLHANLETAIQSRLGRAVDVVHRYDAALNGVAIRMNADEALMVSSLAGILSVTRDFSRQLQTDNGPRWIGADEIWAETGVDGRPIGNAPCVGTCGEGVVAGVIDTGINYDHPSFADVGDDGYDHSNPKGQFYGVCDPVTGLPFCNEKLIGYYDFTGTGPEDDHGHGSHTASTTAGNVLDIELKAPTITVDRAISGVAPHANIISYKGCSGTPVGCQLSALVASINQATLDEVDVINYSIGGGSANPWTDLDAQAFFGAYSAGIFVATSASNDGPGFGTLGSPADAPWVTSVGASTHDRKLSNGIVRMKNVDGSNGIADISGASLTAALPPARVVYAGDYGAPLCGAGTGDPATGEGSGGNPFAPGTFNGEIVVCDRGEYGRVHKSDNVMEAGAGGYVLANDEANGDSLVGDAYKLPGVHISYDNGVILKGWIAANGGINHQGTGEINGSNPSSAPANGDIMASFSSRGANPAAPSVIKPDVTAPGVDILAAWMSEVGTLPGADPEFGVISGTSMSSPHTAGAGALVRAAHPGWTPDEVKSALMTTAFTAPPGNGDEVHPVYKEDGVTLADPFDMGAGRIDLHVATKAGFVLNETVDNYNAANPLLAGDVTTLNMASLGNDDCGSNNLDETCSWTRTIRSTSGQTINWTIDSTLPAGATMTVSDGSGDVGAFMLAPGETKALTFTLDVTGSPKGDWMFGEVRFLSSSPVTVPHAHFPLAVIPKSFGDSARGVKLYFHGNNHDDSAECDYSGAGDADIPPCAPFMSPDDQLDPDSPSAKWIPKSLNGSAAQTPYDP
ncbi:MAG: S8 family serine peptidase, partial [Gammaproteobacteria bacterium]|nr:S8 family serine peptidase [Gammaproteobacteria bacterium]